MMTSKTKVAIAAGLLALAGTGAGIAVAAGDNETPITGSALEKAKDAALEHVGEGRVTDTEVGDEEAYYEVEVTRDDGTEVDVHLDEDFGFVSAEDEAADEDSDDDEGAER